MPCNLLTNNIACNSSAIRGLYPTVEIFPWYPGAVIFDLQGVALGVSGEGHTITASRFAFNVGSDAVSSDVKETTFTHYFSGILAIKGSAEIDKLDSIIVVATDNGGRKLVYGAENGLWKSSQMQRANDANGMQTIEFTTREGQEETLSETFIGGDYEIISGLTIADGSVTTQKMFLQVDDGEDCFIVLPDGNLLPSLSSFIDVDYDGIAGNIILIVPKLKNVNIKGSKYIGDISTFAITFNCPDCTLLTSVSIPLATYCDCYACTSLTAVSAPLATDLYCDDCTSFPLQGFINWATGIQAANTINGTANFTGCAFSVDDVDNDTEANNLKYWLTLNGWNLTFTI